MRLRPGGVWLWRKVLPRKSAWVHENDHGQDRWGQKKTNNKTQKGVKNLFNNSPGQFGYVEMNGTPKKCLPACEDQVKLIQVLYKQIFWPQLSLQVAPLKIRCFHSSDVRGDVAEHYASSTTLWWWPLSSIAKSHSEVLVKWVRYLIDIRNSNTG